MQNHKEKKIQLVKFNVQRIITVNYTCTQNPEETTKFRAKKENGVITHIEQA